MRWRSAASTRSSGRSARRSSGHTPRRRFSLELLALSGVGAVLRATGEREQAATVRTFALGHEQLPPYYSFAARPGSRLSISSYLPSSSPPARLAAAATSLEDLITQALEPVA